MEATSSDSPLLIFDRRGIRDNRPSDDQIAELSNLGRPWVYAGSRNAGMSMDILVLGARKVVLGTELLFSLEELDRLLELTPNVILMIQVDEDGLLNISGRFTLKDIIEKAPEWFEKGMNNVIVDGRRTSGPPSLLSDLDDEKFKIHGMGFHHPNVERVVPFDQWRPENE